MHGRICQSRLGSYPYARSMIGRVIYGLDVLRKSLSLSLSLSLCFQARRENTRLAFARSLNEQVYSNDFVSPGATWATGPP